MSKELRRELRLIEQDQLDTLEMKQLRIRLARLHLLHARELLQNYLEQTS